MDDSKEGGSAPALQGLGNYKGVMLCNRPPDDLSKKYGGEGGAQPPFKSTIAAATGEQLGLQPAKQLNKPTHEVKKCGPSAALRRHCQWIKELQQQVQHDNKQAEDDTVGEVQRKAKMQEVFKTQRDAIRQIKADRDSGIRSSIDPGEVEAIMRPPAKKATAAAAAASGVARKPLWAMTDTERAGCEDDEADALIQFAEGLDFDKYMDDMEFKQCLQVVHDRARKLQREQDAFKDSLVREFNGANEDEEGRSNYGGDFTGAGRSGDSGGRRHRSAGDDRADWDGSTACGDDQQSVARSVHSAAELALQQNPQLKAVHSKGSVQKLIEKAQGQPPAIPEES